MTGSNDTQEEKPQPDLTILPSCLNLTVHREEQGHKRDKDPEDNVVLSCTKATKDEGPGEPEEEQSCPRYSCMSGPTRRNCSDINFIQTYHPVQCHKEGQELQRESLKCRAKGTEDLKNIDLCCPAEVLEDKDPRVPGVKPRAIRKQQLSITDPQEAIGDHQTPKTPRDHQTSRRKLRSSQERRNLAYPTPVWDHPTPINTQLCLRTGLGYQPPGLGQESSQGWVIAAGAAGILGAVVGLVFLGYLVVRWWRSRRGWRKERHSSKKPLRAEESLGKGKDGDWGTPGM